MIERVVFDTSTLVGAALRIGSKPHRALMHALDSYTVCRSESILAELTKVLNRDQFDRYLSRSDRESFLAVIRERTKLFLVDERDAKNVGLSCRDESDNFILALALIAQADLIVSSDHDLLVLNPWRGIPILTPTEFVKQYSLLEDLP